MSEINLEDFQYVATKLQNLVEEEIKDEEDDSSIVLTEGYIRVFEKEDYKSVINMKSKAILPLYYIIYKSEYQGMYEHICATALSEITQLKFEDESGEYLEWSTSKEYLTLFNDYILNK